MKTIHSLKTVQPYFDRVWNGSKSFEVRKNDRDFQAGDEIFLEEYDVEKQEYSGRLVSAKIEYVLNNFIGLADGYIAFSFSVIEFKNN